MQLEHTFTVPADIDRAWEALSDVEQVASCMPGASLTGMEGDHFQGEVKVRVGPMQLTYRGEGVLTERDAAARRIAINASGKEAKGQGTARATVAASLTEVEGGTRVEVVTNLDVTGKPAQFGRGAMADVGQKLLDRFADRLAQQLEGPTAAPASADTTPTAAQGTGRGAGGASDDDVLDLLDLGSDLLRDRLVPILATVVGLLILVGLVRRRR